MSGSQQKAGAWGESIAAARLLAAGFVVLSPSTPESYDMVASRGDQYHRIQVKCTRKQKHHGVSSSRYSFTIARRRRGYTKSDTDFMLLVALDIDRCWVIPVEDVKTPMVAINTASPRKWDKYSEAWHLLD